MSCFSDLHQISDISGISTISQFSGRLFSVMESSQSLLDSYSSAVRNHDRVAIARETGAIEKALNSLVLCEENISEHVKINIVYQCTKKVSLNKGNILSKSTASKLQNLLLIHELDKYMHLSSTTKHMQNKLVLLGIMDLPSADLNPDEKLEVKCCVETMLREMLHDTVLKYEALGGNAKEAAKNSECKMPKKFLEHHDVPAVRWRNKIEDLSRQCESDLLKYIRLMDKWNKLKYENVSQAYLERTGHLLLQAQVAELQAKLTKLSCTIRMFKETSTTVDAFKMLNRLVDEKLKVVTDEICQKEDLKKQYDNLKNAEYDQVLLIYSQLCNAIKKKRHMLDMLK
ncbi:PREDICTED: uncharacterized protein LOC105561733 [Vollenhovia emeryi]|uniref:uncharacterized protein LOC105561733 n=1 Tax=Vollenhovia emeryi TaxID=411798 RepID=UPI0005F54C93|nr:PREDICTED: uncharacterized protein LOC105561733 [Vollenhovia emeryi]XP_011867364.1 PREDICTED: uncharacterized protein LOC105561733 [Vollenhovia emeryi]XP_011867365.1 PREDICTED: uncharacterized protein LOC105561733 [Vollenhovia emeryi]XP_011867366.1 PREDICTED: uncharacterized protein LOC105561733 [Vollenhovia emeryi]XP_011867367.1 PREDICTED: uncharacterized protein LOC105561733 [Vollenhovia emeryi]